MYRITKQLAVEWVQTSRDMRFAWVIFEISILGGFSWAKWTTKMSKTMQSVKKCVIRCLTIARPTKVAPSTITHVTRSTSNRKLLIPKCCHFTLQTVRHVKLYHWSLPKKLKSPRAPSIVNQYRKLGDKIGISIKNMVPYKRPKKKSKFESNLLTYIF